MNKANKIDGLKTPSGFTRRFIPAAGSNARWRFHLCAEPGRLASADIKPLEKLAENAFKFANLDSQTETVRSDLEFRQAIIEATGLQRTIRYFSELTADVRRFNWG